LLENALLVPCGFFLPVCFFQRKPAMANEPAERHHLFLGQRLGSVPRPLRNLGFQGITSLKLGHLRAKPERNRRRCSPLLLTGVRIEWLDLVIPVPPLTFGTNPALLVRPLCHSSP